MNESAPITTSTRAQQAIGALYLATILILLLLVLFFALPVG